MPAFNSSVQLETPDYEGYYIATVVANNDPKKLQRVKVTIPELLEGAAAMLPWLLPLNGSSFGFSPDYGEVNVPPVGAMVCVSFQEGDLQYGLIKGGIPLAAATIPDELAVNYPNRRGFRDPAGNTFWIDSTPGEKTVQFVHSSGASISIDNDGNVGVDTSGTVSIICVDATVQASTSVEVTSPDITMTGDVSIVGNLDISGLTTGVGEGEFGLIKVSHHQHSGVTNGDHVTGPPNNF